LTRTFPSRIDTLLAIRGDGRLLLGRERITLLEAVMHYGSITKAAEHAGFSYKTAWDAVNAINNLLPRPAFITHTGGPRGGGAEVTEEGRRLITAFRRLEEKLSRITSSITEDGLTNDDDLLFWQLAMKISVSNAFHCKIVEVSQTSTSVEVKVALAKHFSITAEVNRTSADELQLTIGKDAIALINAASIMLAPINEGPGSSAKNVILGHVISRADGYDNSEVAVDIGNSKILVANISLETASELAVVPGQKLSAVFHRSQVILACD
jgi:molybdate transport system regulatory protein